MSTFITVIVSFGAAVLAGLGVGSGGIMVVYLTLAVALPQLDAQLLNLVFFISSSVAALFINMIKKRLIPGIVIPISVSGCVFSVGGSLLARDIESKALGKGFGVLLVILGGLSLFSSLKRSESIKKRQKYSNRTSK